VNAIALSNDVSDLPYNTDRQGTQAISGWYHFENAQSHGPEKYR